LLLMGFYSGGVKKLTPPFNFSEGVEGVSATLEKNKNGGFFIINEIQTFSGELPFIIGPFMVGSMWKDCFRIVG
jgi:hypothetical protein